MDQMENCFQCNSPMEQLPMVAIMKVDPMLLDRALKTMGEFMAVGICTVCHQKPPRPLKAHYFKRAQMHKALSRAGSTEIGE